MPHLRGTLSMARTEAPDSANSQFFIVFYPRFALDRKYTVFGRVIGGMAAVDAIERGEPPEKPTKIVQASMAVDNMPPPVMARARCGSGCGDGRSAEQFAVELGTDCPTELVEGPPRDHAR